MFMISRAALLLGLFMSLGCSKKTEVTSVETSTKPTVATSDPSQKWLRQLKLNRSDSQQEAADELGPLAAKNPELLPELIAALQDETCRGEGEGQPGMVNSTREGVIVALMNAGPKGEQIAVEQALPVLLQNLTNPAAKQREHAAYAIARLGPAAVSASDKLWTLAKDDSIHVREAALRAMAKVAPEQTGPFTQLLHDPQSGVRISAADHVVDFGPYQVADVPALILALAAEEEQVRQASASILRDLGPGAAPAAEALAKLLRDSAQELDANQPLMLEQAHLEALIAIGEPAVKPLQPLLKDRNLLVKYLTLQVLGEIGDSAKSAKANIEALIQDPSGDVALEAAATLAKVTGDASAAKPLMKQAFTFPRANVRLVAMRTLIRMGPVGASFAADALPLLDDPEPLVQVATIEYCSLLDDKALAPILPKLGQFLSSTNADVFAKTSEVLIELGPTAAPVVDAIITALPEREDRREQMQLLKILQAIGPDAKAAIPAVLLLAKNRNTATELRERAIPVIFSILNESNAQAAFLMDFINDSEKSVRLEVAKQLPALGTILPDLEDRLMTALKSDRDYNVRAEIAKSASKLGAAATGLLPGLEAGVKSDVVAFAYWCKIAVSMVQGQPQEARNVILPALIAPRHKYKNLAIEALGDVVPVQVEDWSIVVQLAEEKTTQEQGARLMASFPGDESVKRLIELSRSRNEIIQRQSIQSLATLANAFAPAKVRLQQLAKAGVPEAKIALKKLNQISEK